MHRRVLGASVVIWLLAGCGGGSAPTVAPTPTPAATTSPTSAPSVPAASASAAAAPPATYATLTSSGWAKVVAAPDMYLGDGLQLWGCITKFEPKTKPDAFQALASNRERSDWSADGKLGVFTGKKDVLARFANGDVVALKVAVRASSAPAGQGAGTTLPSFEAVEIAKVGSCR